jgi:hypothetical protein
MEKPLIKKNNDEVREMNDEELEWYEALIAGFEPIPDPD